jgi:hypothetical protein
MAHRSDGGCAVSGGDDVVQETVELKRETMAILSSTNHASCTEQPMVPGLRMLA